MDETTLGPDSNVAFFRAKATGLAFHIYTRIPSIGALYDDLGRGDALIQIKSLQARNVC